MISFSPEQYRMVFDASIEVLREQGFTIARSDYRFGVITTEPLEAATALEFWIGDATTATQRRSDTLNAQQRTAIIRIGQAEDQDAFQLTAEVQVQRLQRPDRYLTHSATGQLTAAYAETPLHLRQQGIDRPYAYDLERDPWLEQRLLQAIRDAAAAQQ